MNDFMSLGLPQAITDALARMNFNTPTPIQAQAIPPALEGRDVLGSAQTGTGKTGAFSIPMLAWLMQDDTSKAIVMTPTRELATQVEMMVRQMVDKSSNMRSVLLIGGEPIGKQLDQLRRNPRIIIGTPGRINDHLRRGSLSLKSAGFLVLDETDRMLDMGFGVQIEAILKYMPAQRQTLLFSATLPQHIVKLSEQYLTNPVRVAVGSTTVTAPKIKQETLRVAVEEKYDVLTQQLDARTGSVIVFVKTKHGADRLARKLERENHSAEAIHGDLRQSKRDRVIKAFRAGKYRILVATDVAARGLDIPHIEHVINYDLPQCPEDYIHRIGRTGRNGAEGEACNIVAPEDNSKWRAIAMLLDPEAAAAERRSSEARRGQNGNRPSSSKGYKGRSAGGKRPWHRDVRGNDNRNESSTEARHRARRDDQPERHSGRSENAAQDRNWRQERDMSPSRDQGARNANPRPRRDDFPNESRGAGRGDDFRPRRPFGDQDSQQPRRNAEHGRQDQSRPNRDSAPRDFAPRPRRDDDLRGAGSRDYASRPRQDRPEGVRSPENRGENRGYERDRPSREGDRPVSGKKPHRKGNSGRKFAA